MPLFSPKMRVIQPCEKCGKPDGAKFYWINGEWKQLCKKCKKTVVDEKKGKQ